MNAADMEHAVETLMKICKAEFPMLNLQSDESLKRIARQLISRMEGAGFTLVSRQRIDDMLASVRATHQRVQELKVER